MNNLHKKLKILAIKPLSIGGRLTMSSLYDGFDSSDTNIVFFDKLSENNHQLESILKNNVFDYIVGYDFSALKIKIDNKLRTKSINYFSDVIEDNHSGNYWKNYYKCLFMPDNYTFYWDKELYTMKKHEIKNLFYMPHFVNCDLYKNLNLQKEHDIMFAGRLDTDFRLDFFIKLIKKFEFLNISWFAIEKHFNDALSRCSEPDMKLLKKVYKGFIDNEKDMALEINKTKIVVNMNAQGISSLNYRTMQTLACETLLLSDYRAEVDDLFELNVSFVCYENFNDIVEKIFFYLENAAEYQKIVKNARKIIEINHNSKNSVKKMIKLTRT